MPNPWLIFFTINHDFHFTYIKYLAISHRTDNSIFSFRTFKEIYKRYRNRRIFREEFDNCLKLEVQGCVLSITTHLGQYFIRLYEPAQTIKAIWEAAWHHTVFWESCVNEMQSQFLGLVIFGLLSKKYRRFPAQNPYAENSMTFTEQPQQIPMMPVPWQFSETAGHGRDFLAIFPQSGEKVWSGEQHCSHNKEINHTESISHL